MTLESKVIDRRLVVLGAILIQFALGVLYAWPVFTPALREAGWSKLDTQIAFSLSLVALAAVMVWGGRHMVSWGPRRLAVSGGLILGASYVLAGLLGESSFPVVVLCIGVMGGMGIGLGYMVPIAVCMRWFPDRRGMITGIAVAGFGFGAMGWIKLAGEWGQLLETYGLGATFILYGLAFILLVLTGSRWMIWPPEGWRPAGWTPPPAAVTAVQEYSRREMVRTVAFALLFLTFVASSGAGLMSIGLMKLYPMEALEAGGLSPAEASTIAGTAMAVFFSIANGLGRIIWGTLSDRIGPQTALLLMTFSQGVTLLLFATMAGHEILLYCGASLIGFNFGGNFALFPSIVASLFGPTNVGQNYPMVFLAYGVGGIIGPILGGFLGDLGNFPLAFTLCGGACLAGTVLVSLIRPLPVPRPG
ncbi:MAG: Major facilitator superfamily MFS1 [Rhodospirillaceae bacterium]|nr:MAG: Major facilitator superfamily MFS1 [Rhodospirillaceae bacterium]